VLHDVLAQGSGTQLDDSQPTSARRVHDVPIQPELGVVAVGIPRTAHHYRTFAAADPVAACAPRFAGELPRAALQTMVRRTVIGLAESKSITGFTFVEARVHVRGGRILRNVQATMSILIAVAVVVCERVGSATCHRHNLRMFPSAAIDKFELVGPCRQIQCCYINSICVLVCQSNGAGDVPALKASDKMRTTRGRLPPSKISLESDWNCEAA